MVGLQMGRFYLQDPETKTLYYKKQNVEGNLHAVSPSACVPKRYILVKNLQKPLPTFSAVTSFLASAAVGFQIKRYLPVHRKSQNIRYKKNTTCMVAFRLIFLSQGMLN